MNLRDAHEKSNGYLYQRYYCVYLLLNNEIQKSEPVEIVEEGAMDNMSFEDITIRYSNGKKITYQIKHNSSKKNINMVSSNNDLFKTISEKNNINLDKIYYITSKYNNNSSYGDDLLKWKNNQLTSDEIHNIIMNLVHCKSSEYLIKTQKLFNELSQDEITDYLKRIIIDDGENYDILKQFIENFIETQLNTQDKLLKIYR